MSPRKTRSAETDVANEKRKGEEGENEREREIEDIANALPPRMITHTRASTKVNA